MYEALTSFIGLLDGGVYGTWHVDKGTDGPEGQPRVYNFPYVEYSRIVSDLIDEVYRFADEHGEMGLTAYQCILEASDVSSPEHADAATLDGRTVMAILMWAVRGERFCEGLLLGLLKDGCIRRWLERLRELDGEDA